MKKLTKIILSLSCLIILFIAGVITFFTSLNVYAKTSLTVDGFSFVSFNSNVAQVGGSVNTISTTLNKNIVLQNGKYEVYRNNQKVIDDSLRLGDELRLIPCKDSVSNLALTDVREITIGLNVYKFNVNTKAIETDKLVVNGSGENLYYTYIVSSNDLLDGNTLNVNAVFDRYCDITVIDTEKPIESRTSTTYHWAVDGDFKFPMETATNGLVIARGSSTDKVLLGYARIDVGSKNTVSDTFDIVRNDYAVADYNKLGSLLHCSLRGFGVSNYTNDNISDCKTVASIVPGIVLQTVYLKVFIDYELKLASAKTEDRSALRFVVKFDKTDVDNYNKYNIRIGSGNCFGIIHNYLTTEEQLTLGNSGITYDKINTTHWYASESWSSYDFANNLGLYNGTGKNSKEMEGKASYTYQSFSSGEDIWQRIYENENYYAYAISVTGLNFANYNKQYVFMPIITIPEVCGYTTSFVINAVKISPKTVANQKLKDIVFTTKPLGTYYKIVDEQGSVYYSRYAIDDIMWLYNF